MGGYLAALYAARHPEVERVVLMAPAFDFHDRWIAWHGPEKIDRWLRSGQIDVFHYSAGREVPLSSRLITDARQYEPFPDVRQPALIFHGRRDDVVPIELSERFAAMRPNAALRALDSDHELGDVLETMWRETSAFLRGL
jgi:pimeloyl-ACP methyl ester carboxylesterase